jgi:hypothetical protein
MSQDTSLSYSYLRVDWDGGATLKKARSHGCGLDVSFLHHEDLAIGLGECCIHDS